MATDLAGAGAVRCDVCSIDWRFATITIHGTIGGDTTCRCSDCERLITEGALRQEANGRWRRWHPTCEWVPGELIPTREMIDWPENEARS